MLMYAISVPVGLIYHTSISPPNRGEVEGDEAISAVIYDTPSDVVAGVGPDTSENVAYGVTQTVNHKAYNTWYNC